jgi:hypothetical protein
MHLPWNDLSERVLQRDKDRGRRLIGGARPDSAASKRSGRSKRGRRPTRSLSQVAVGVMREG